MAALPSHEARDRAFREVAAGRLDPARPTIEAADDLWCRIVARGRIVAQLDDGTRDHTLRVCLTIVEHPDLEPHEVYALFSLGLAPATVYRTTPQSAQLALTHPSAFNL